MKVGAPLYVCKKCTTIAMEIRTEKTTTNISGNCPRCGETEFTSTIKLGYTRSFVDMSDKS